MVDAQVPPTGIYGKMVFFEGRSWTGRTIKTTGMRKTTDKGLLLLLLLTPEAAGMDASITIKRLHNRVVLRLMQSVISSLLDGWLSKTNHWTRPHL